MVLKDLNHRSSVIFQDRMDVQEKVNTLGRTFQFIESAQCCMDDKQSSIVVTLVQPAEDKLNFEFSPSTRPRMQHPNDLLIEDVLEACICPPKGWQVMDTSNKVLAIFFDKQDQSKILTALARIVEEVEHHCEYFEKFSARRQLISAS